MTLKWDTMRRNVLTDQKKKFLMIYALKMLFTNNLLLDVMKLIFC
jgi:hypothetical protein